jgi:putative aldouronate transport system substrate-binding protein
MTRRGFLSTAAGTAGAVAAAPLLAACGHSGSGGTGTTSATELQKILPAYVPSSAVKPDIPSVNGSDPGFITYPANPLRTVSDIPGTGGNYSAITPLWASIPPVNNQYDLAVNQALGATVNVQPSNGNLYGQFLPTLFAGNKLPDWIDIPGYMTQPLNFGPSVQAKFADLTPYLAGNNIKKYPNLAAIPTGGWQAGIWDDKIFGIPVYAGNHIFSGTIFYRADILDKLGIGTPSVTSAQDLFNLGKEVNDPKHNRWAFDDPIQYLAQPFGITNNPPNWTTNAKGDLVASWETEQFVEMLNWEATIVKAGMMHPEAIALNSSNAKQRFWSGEVVITGDGLGGWTGDDAVSGQAANKSYVRMAFPPFTANGTGTPTYVLQNTANLFSYLNKSLSKSQVEECLRLANYIAAPFGSYEYTLVNYGVKTTDWTPSSSGPVLTTAGLKNVAGTYSFLATGQNVASVQQGFVDVVKASCAWQQNAGKYAYKPLFWNMNVSVPASLASAMAAPTLTVTATGNVPQDVVRGRKTIADFKAAVTEWQRNGGNSLRKFFESVRSKYGDA